MITLHINPLSARAAFLAWANLQLGDGDSAALGGTYTGLPLQVSGYQSKEDAVRMHKMLIIIFKHAI